MQWRQLTALHESPLSAVPLVGFAWEDPSYLPEFGIRTPRNLRKQLTHEGWQCPGGRRKPDQLTLEHCWPSGQVTPAATLLWQHGRGPMCPSGTEPGTVPRSRSSRASDPATGLPSETPSVPQDSSLSSSLPSPGKAARLSRAITRTAATRDLPLQLQLHTSLLHPILLCHFSWLQPVLSLSTVNSVCLASVLR